MHLNKYNKRKQVLTAMNWLPRWRPYQLQSCYCSIRWNACLACKEGRKEF